MAIFGDTRLKSMAHKNIDIVFTAWDVLAGVIYSFYEIPPNLSYK